MPAMFRRLFLLTFCALLSACTEQGGRVTSSRGVDIIGGRSVLTTDSIARSVVALYDAESEDICSATLLTDSTILTAAHCVQNSPTQLRVLFGQHLTDRSFEKREITAVKVCDQYAVRADEEKDTCDIAVLSFGGPLPEGYAPALLIHHGHVPSVNETVTMVGFGMSDVTLKSGAGELRIVDAKIEDSGFSRSEFLVDQRSGRGGCHGDSGGPVFTAAGVLIGVVNRGVNDPDGRCDVSMGVASVGYYADWISSALAELSSRK